MFRALVENLQTSKYTLKLLKMSENLTQATFLGKRSATDDPQSDATQQKKKKTKQTLAPSENKKRKIALLVSYNGKGYYGVQINRGFATIESELFAALIKVGAWYPEAAEHPSKMWFQRGSRTDKGVSATGQTFSLNAILVPDFVQKLNDELPAKIRIMSYVRTTKGFDAKNFCDSRTYMYMIPTFAFADIEKFITQDYRIEAEKIERAREILKRFMGTHNFHNFTSGVKFAEKRAIRYIINFECSDPYVQDGMEFATIRVKGQSFMLHQIRKMIGLTIAIVRGYCGESTIDQCWQKDLVDIPKAPGLGLVLEQLHFSGYNRKYGKDGLHEPIDWSTCKESIEKFKEEHIITDIVAEEKSEKVMFNWLRTLQYHNFGVPRTEGPQKPWVRAEVFQKDPEQKGTSTGDDNKSDDNKSDDNKSEVNKSEVNKAQEKESPENLPIQNDPEQKETSASEDNKVKVDVTEEKVGLHDEKTTDTEGSTKTGDNVSEKDLNLHAVNSIESKSSEEDLSQTAK